MFVRFARKLWATKAQKHKDARRDLLKDGRMEGLKG